MQPLRHQTPQSLAQLEKWAKREGWDHVLEDVRDARQVRMMQHTNADK